MSVLRYPVPQRALLCVPALLLAAACAQPNPSIRYKATGELPVTADGLHRIQSAHLAAVYLKPGASFAGYEAIVIDPVAVSYKTPPRKPTSSSNRSRGNFALSESHMERLKRIFQEVFEAELQKSQDSRFVTEPGSDALRVSDHIVDLVVDAPPQRGGEIEFVLSAGEMTLILDVRDSVTGEPLARVADRRAVQPASSGPGRLYYSNPVRNWGEVRNTFQRWAGLLREGLDTLKQLPEVPEA